MNIFQKIFLLTIIVFIPPIHSQVKETISLDMRQIKLPFGLEKTVPKDKPIVGIALSGGGARALSQIGVLKALEENGIETEIIVGTSMGSIIGGLYASGYSLMELDSIVQHTAWNDLLTLEGDKKRRELFVAQKITDDRALFSLRLDGLKLVFPTAFNEGQRLSNYLYLLTKQAPVHTASSFDDLIYKYRAVCTDLVTGELLVVGEGQLSKAMRASSSVTFFLEPVNWGDKLMVDGGLLANIPVDITRKTGADFVIAVNTTSPLHPKDEIDLPWIIADQVISIPMKKLNETELSNADYVITPQLKDVFASEFTGIDSLISLGYNQTIGEINNLKKTIESELYNNIRQNEKYYHKLIIQNINGDEFNKLNKECTGNDSVSSTVLKRELIRLYETGKFKTIRFEISLFPDSTTLKVNCDPNPRIQKVKIFGNTQLDLRMIETIVSSVEGEHYKEDKIVRMVSDLLRLYRKSGYLLAEIKQIEFDEMTGSLLLQIEEGLISEIHVEGKFTEETLIRRDVAIKEGDFFLYNDVKEGLEKLTSSGFFKDILMYVKKEENKNILIISVEEKPSGILRFGFLTDETYNAQFSLDIRDENIFGSGTEVGLFLHGGFSNGAFIFETKNHRIMDTYLTYNLSTYYKFSNISVYRDEPTGSEKSFSRVKAGEYIQSFYGFSLSIGTQIEKFGNLIFTGKYQFDEVYNIQGNITENYKTKLVSLAVNTTVDNMDRYPYPLSGMQFSGFYETAQSFLGGDESFTAVGMDLRYFFKVDNRSTLVPRVKIGFGDNTMPLSEQFLLGGMDSFFGMNENEFRGRQIFLSSLMYRLKLPFQIFFDTYLKLRYDLGSTWEVQSQIKFKDLRHGIGGIISFDTPIGPAEFGIGRSFLIKRNIPENILSWGEVIFYFSVGYRVNISPASF
jgi:NTE family protein